MDTVGRADVSRNRISQSEPQNRPPGARRRAGDGTRRAGDSGVGVLDRSMSLLQLLGDGPRTLRSLAQASGLPRPTAHRLLVALEVHGLVGRTADGAFRLGPRLTELALRADHGLELGTLAAGVLTRLHDQTGESVQLYLRSGDRRLCVAARDAGAGLRDSVPVGALLPLDAGSGGKVLLAWSDDASRFPAAGPDELAAVRRRGPVSRLGSSPGRRLAPVVVAAARELAALATVGDGAPAPSATATPRERGLLPEN
jgi:hypothetical protein